jgi:hypothetical protein
MSRNRSQKQKSQRRKSQRRFRGGNGSELTLPSLSAAGSAANYGVSAFGGIGDQHAMPGSNQIHVNRVSNCGGGKRKRNRTRKNRK